MVLGGFLSFLHTNNFVNTFLQLNSINNSNGTVLQKLLTVIDNATVLYFVFSILLFFLKRHVFDVFFIS